MTAYVGTSGSYSNSRAYLFAGRWRELGNGGAAYGINNARDVVGSFRDSVNSSTIAFLINPVLDEKIEYLGLLPGGSYSGANAINASGTAVGFAEGLIDGKPIQLPVIFERATKVPVPIDISNMQPGSSWEATDINDHGDIIGTFVSATWKLPFVKLANGAATVIPGFKDEGIDASVIAINNAGRVIGNLRHEADKRERGFYFENGLWTKIESPEHGNTWVEGLNEAGDIVGGFSCGQGTCPFALIGGEFVDLMKWRPPYYDSAFARAINNRGDILIGYGCYQSATTRLATPDCALYGVLSHSRQRPVVQLPNALPIQTPQQGKDFGAATMALRNDTAFVGAPCENDASGAVYVYQKVDSAWSGTQRLTVPSSSGWGLFGASVAFDGETLAIGAPGHDKVYVFKLSDTGWTQSTVLPTASRLGSDFGAAVAVEGSRIVVGAPQANELHASFISGAVYVFDWDGKQWNRSRIVPADSPMNTNARFGSSVAMDGDAVLATTPLYYGCSPNCNDGSSFAGNHIGVFRRDATSWSEQRLKVNKFGFVSGSSDALKIGGDVLAIRSDPFYSTSISLYRRGTPGENIPWVEQDWLPDVDVVGVVGQRVITMRDEGSTFPFQVLNREGLIWTDSFDFATDNTTKYTNIALDGSNMLAVAADGVVTPFLVYTEKPAISIFSPEHGKPIERGPADSIELSYKIENFPVGADGHHFTVQIDSAAPARYDQLEKISLGRLLRGDHIVTVTLMSKDTVPILSQSSVFSVDVIEPYATITSPSNGSEVVCYKNESTAPRVTIGYWTLGDGRTMRLLADDQPFGGSMSNLDDVRAINLCDLALNDTHGLRVQLRDGEGKTVAESERVTFKLSKAVPNVTIWEPVDGHTGYARSGFNLIYGFERGYDSANIAVTLNGKPLSGPFDTNKTNSSVLPGERLRDGLNELVVTVMSENSVVQTTAVRFHTTEPDGASKSKGGTVDMWLLALFLLALYRQTARHPGLRITPI